MEPLERGRYQARLARTLAEVAAAQRLRGWTFHGDPTRTDTDRFDALCAQVVIIDRLDGAIVGAFRMLPIPRQGALAQSYSAQFYDLSALAAYPGARLELGRFCVAPNRSDPDILRIAWGALAAYVDAADIALLFGCASFAGTDPAPYAGALATLRKRHLAPPRWRPARKAPEVAGLPDGLAQPGAPMDMPPILRTYLGMGGWVSDHAVIDRAMNTLHVFVGVETAAIPEARKRALRLVAGPARLPA